MIVGFNNGGSVDDDDDGEDEDDGERSAKKFLLTQTHKERMRPLSNCIHPHGVL